MSITYTNMNKYVCIILYAGVPNKCISCKLSLNNIFVKIYSVYSVCDIFRCNSKMEGEAYCSKPFTIST